MKPLRVIGVGLSLCCLVLMSSPVEAGPFGGSLEDKVARMQDQLGLSDEQPADVLETFEAVRTDTTCRELDGIDARMECIQAKRAVIDEALGDILTDQQLADLQALREERKSPFQRRR